MKDHNGCHTPNRGVFLLFNKKSSTNKCELPRRRFSLFKILIGHERSKIPIIPDAPRGFSLFEVLIAMAIMSSASILLYMAWSSNQIRVRKTAINYQAAFLLDQVISELEIKYGQRLTQLPEEEKGTFKEHPRFTWSMQSKDFEMPSLQSILISNDQGSEALLTMVDQLTEHLNQSIKEMRVTIKYQLDKKSVEYSATTFLVDYNRPLPMVGAMGGAGGGTEEK